MSKERAIRRAQRERESALKTAARAAERERAERRTARRRALRSRFVGFSGGRPTGVLAERRRTRLRLLIAALVFLQILVWLIRPDWPARLGALAVTLLVFPLIAAFTL